MDSNVPMYLVGASEPHRLEALSLLDRLVDENQRLVTDAEVLQEILHRYVAIGRRDAIQPAFDAVQRVVDHIFPVEALDVEHAKLILLSTERLSARDAVHLAVMERQGVTKIASFDRGFDGYPGIQRIGP